MRKTLIKQIFALALGVFFFAVINIFLYGTITKRLANNFSGVSQLKMINVEDYLPFEENNKLPKVQSSLLIEDNQPVLDGAAALVPVYGAIIENTYSKGTVKYEGGVFSSDNYYGENFASDSKMKYQNTVRGFNALVDGTIDVFFTAYPSKDQLNSAKEKNVELELVPIGLEAFVFFVNSKNPIENLTSDQIKDIYACKITNWKEVGGIDRSIYPVTRVKNSGSQTMMDKFMGDVEYGKVSPIAITGGAIGYSFRYYLSGIVDNQNVKMINLNGISPTKENIKNNEYPLVASFYLAYRKDNTNPNIKPLVDWILSSEGQKLIEEVGYVGL